MSDDGGWEKVSQKKKNRGEKKKAPKVPQAGSKKKNVQKEPMSLAVAQALAEGSKKKAESPNGNDFLIFLLFFFNRAVRERAFQYQG